MNFRLARPAVLIDINRLPNLSHIDVDGGLVRIGTLARHVSFERPPTTGPLGRLLSIAAKQVGHHPIRVRGTFGGSLAHADPAAEWCLIAVLLDATIVASSLKGSREIAASEFFRTVFTTSLEPIELLMEVRMTDLPTSSRVGFVEFSRRSGDFAVVAAGVALDIENKRVSKARVALAGVGGTPLRATGAEDVLAGQPLNAQLFEEASQTAAADVEPMGDIHGSSEYRRDLVRVLVRRALEQAAGES